MLLNGEFSDDYVVRAELKHANVVCVTYSVTDDNTIESVTERFVDFL